MDHAAAHERIADLALEAGGLRRLEASGAPEDRALLVHVAGCPACRADAAAFEAVSDALRLALADVPGASGYEPIAAPESLRSAVLDAAHRQVADPRDARPVTMATSRSSTRGARRWLGGFQPRWAAGLAAAIAIALLGGVAGSQLQRQSQAGGGESLVAVVATVDRILVADQHRFVPLRATDGSAAGTVAWSRQDFAVLTSSLAQPAAGKTYRCWLEWAETSTSVGVMEFAGGTAYWTGSVGDWAAVAFAPGARFVVTLEPAGSPSPGAGPSSPVILEANLGS